jgi:hypothetical protein
MFFPFGVAILNFLYFQIKNPSFPRRDKLLQRRYGKNLFDSIVGHMGRQMNGTRKEERERGREGAVLFFLCPMIYQ